MSAIDPSGPVHPRPGQFYMLAAEDRWGGGEDERPYLPRAFSFAKARRSPGGVELDFLLEDVGPGTARLIELVPGDGLILTGPLGIGFDPGGLGRSVLVGGGIGAAPLLSLEEGLSKTKVLLGFRSAAYAAASQLFRGDPIVVTDDGSTGRRALVTELLSEELDSGTDACVYACGPPGMLEGVRAICAEREVPAQLAMESGMACGFGACFGCVVPTRSGYVRLCVDGPVIDAAELETALVPGAGH